MALWRNLMTLPPVEHISLGKAIYGIKSPKEIISSLKERCLEFGRTALLRETEAIKSQLT